MSLDWACDHVTRRVHSKKNQNKIILRKLRKRPTDNELEATTRDICRHHVPVNHMVFWGSDGISQSPKKLTFLSRRHLHLLDTDTRRPRFRWACPRPFPCLHLPTGLRERRSLSNCSWKPNQIERDSEWDHHLSSLDHWSRRLDWLHRTLWSLTETRDNTLNNNNFKKEKNAIF